MNVSAEITLMPLNNDYKKIIKDFILSLRNTDFDILENPLSTQIYGDFEPIMEVHIQMCLNIKRMRFWML